MPQPIPDRIEKKILLRAPRSRVWRALTEAREFSEWFRVDLRGQFGPGLEISGQVTHPGYEHLTMTVRVERMDPERLFSFRWHPAAIDPKVDYSAEPTTLVEFRLEETPEGTLLTVTESGFQALPVGRQGFAHEANSSGWEEQLKNIERHVASHPSPRA
jgi:uncharacterized protein YndB with AHSA1/START domain